ncbi:MAG: PEGA domain-containing protein [bacterium]
MTLRTRRLLFCFFVLVFLVATPGVLFYAAGYSFDWQNARLIKTGAFYFDSLPKNAQIFVDNELSGVTPNFISRLSPEQYLVRISKNGYTTWQKSLPVEEQITTEARNILLIPKSPNITWVADTASSTEKYFLTQAQKSAKQLTDKIATSTKLNFANQAIYQNNLYVLQKPNLILYRADLSGAVKQQLSREPLATSTIPYQIKMSPEQTAVFEPDGKLYLLNKDTGTFKFLADGVQGADFSPDNEKMFWWTAHEIWVYWLKDVYGQPYRKAGDRELITRYSDKITQAVWFAKTSENIIYGAADSNGQTQIKITELDGRDQRNTFDIWTAKDPDIYWNQNNDLLYVLTEGKLYSADLLSS